PPALLPETQARRENAYALWRLRVRSGGEVTSERKRIRVCAPLAGAQARLNGRVGPGILGLAEEAAYGDFYRCEWARGQ
ncbi:MAG: hypothetical protein K0Q84_3045, partial [Arthrobacter sp.]|nr:hypothetical protein [Arthrobacter sp.]